MVNKGYKKTEIGIIPEDWNVKTFIEAGTYFKGSGISMRDVVFSGYPCIMYGDIYVKFDTHFSKCDYHITAQTASRSIRAQHGDLFFTASGETAEEIGKCVSYQGKDDIFIGGDIIAIRPSIEYDSLFLAYVQNSALLINQKASYAQGCSVVHINSDNIKKLTFASPSKRSEQEAIAKALSDIDTLIANLEKLIAKKKAIKQGAMQILFTGKKRIPGFHGKWVEKTIRDYSLLVTKGTTPTSIGNSFTDSGITFVKIESILSNRIEKRLCAFISPETNTVLSRSILQENDILFSIAGALGRCAIVTKELLPANTNQALAIIRLDKSSVSLDYIYLYLQSEPIKKHIASISVQGAQTNLSLENINDLPLFLPADINEQTAIANIFFDMDSEISDLEEKLSKYRNIKTGMMQTLLTGRIRLSEQDTPVKTVAPPKVTEQQKPESKGHNQPFDDAVAIAAIVNAFYSDKYPLGRKKVQKLLYLLRRRQDASTVAFKKKAAGPYADEVRYKGGEPIAKRNGYVTVNNSKRGSKFAKGKNIGKALNYVVKWDMQPELDWLAAQFLHTKVDTLELLATIDMAMCDLEGNGVTPSVDSVKKLIASDKEWKAKLKKAYFSDADIGWAITKCMELFDSTGR